MMKRTCIAIGGLVLALALVACGASTRATKPLHVDYTFAPEPERSGIVRGTVTTDKGEAAIGATCAVEHPTGEVVRITDERGEFAMDQALPEGKYTLFVYYGDTKVSHPIEVRSGYVTVVRVTNLHEPPGGEVLE